MKIDKKNPKHWVYLAVYTANIFVGILLRLLTARRTKFIVLYGHKLNGNLKALYEHLTANRGGGFVVSFLVIDPVYYAQLQTAGTHALNGLRLRDAISVCRSTCVITDHGPHALIFLLKLTDVKFIDVWHGIPFKGFDEADFGWLHGYHATFVPSPSMKRMYEMRYGFDPSQVKVTGYARTDRLVTKGYDRKKILRELEIRSTYKKIILFAPTWSHGARGRSNIPFNMPPEGFFSRLNDLAHHNELLIMFRAHLNSKNDQIKTQSNIKFVPLASYPNAEELLFVSDVLVSDWSSIVFDFLVLHRPTIFIDTKAPFAKGFSYGPEYRFGPIVHDFGELVEAMLASCRNPESVLREHGGQMQHAAAEVYGEFADGRATHRCVQEIYKLIAPV